MQRPQLPFVTAIATFLLVSVASAQFPDFPFVFAVGQAEIKLPPDIAEVSFEVLAFDKNANAALSVVHERSADLLSLFKKYDIPETDIVSYEIDKSARQRESQSGGPLDILGYELSRYFTVTVRDLDKYTAFMTALFAMQNTEDISVEFDRTDRGTVETELLAKAADDARRQATAMAKGAGAELGGVFALSQSDFDYVTASFGLGTHARAAYSSSVSGVKAGERLFVPATVTFQRTVNVLYELKRP